MAPKLKMGSVLYVIVILLFCFMEFSSAECPDENSLKPHCWCLDSYYGGAIFCKDIFNPRDLAHPVEACVGKNVTALGVFNSSLQYIPYKIFKGTKFVKISFVNTQLMSLSNGPLAFEGLEDTLEEIRASQTHYSTLWRFRQLRKLREMRLIDINSIMMESLSERLPELPKLDAFGLSRAGISYLDEEVFADLKAMKILHMEKNLLTEMQRSMFSRPAKLEIMNLQDNHLENFPEDFFDDMPNLMEVQLGRNRFTTLNERTFGWVYTHLTVLDLTDNPLRCDCRIIWIVNKKNPMWLHAKCAEPESVKGVKLNHLSLNSLWCLRQ